MSRARLGVTAPAQDGGRGTMLKDRVPPSLGTEAWSPLQALALQSLCLCPVAMPRPRLDITGLRSPRPMGAQRKHGCFEHLQTFKKQKREPCQDPGEWRGQNMGPSGAPWVAACGPGPQMHLGNKSHWGALIAFPARQRLHSHTQGDTQAHAPHARMTPLASWFGSKGAVPVALQSLCPAFLPHLPAPLPHCNGLGRRPRSAACLPE
jgi:hypothetical protein